MCLTFKLDINYSKLTISIVDTKHILLFVPFYSNQNIDLFSILSNVHSFPCLLCLHGSLPPLSESLIPLSGSLGMLASLSGTLPPLSESLPNWAPASSVWVTAYLGPCLPCLGSGCLISHITIHFSTIYISALNLIYSLVEGASTKQVAVPNIFQQNLLGE